MRFRSLAACLFLALALAACSQPGPATSLPEGNTQNSASGLQAAQSSGTGNQAQVAALSDSLTDAQIQINGIVYTIPGTFSEYFDAGWTTQDDVENMNLPYTAGSASLMKNEGAVITISYYNLIEPEKDQKAVNCPIHELRMDAEYNSDTQVMLPGGITFGSTAAEIKAAYGKPHEESDDGTLTYALTEDTSESGVARNRIALSVDESNGLNFIIIRKED